MKVFTLGARSFHSNTYILSNRLEAAVVDPSAPLGEIDAVLKENYLTLRYILLTHAHFDHFMTLDSLRCTTKAPLYIHKADASALADSELNASAAFGMEYYALSADELLSDGDTLPLGGERIEVISTPGHTQGSVCYLSGDVLVTGDTLFESGYGRYDLPGGDGAALLSSLKLLSARRDDPTIYPGHGGSCKLSNADIIRHLRLYSN